MTDAVCIIAIKCSPVCNVELTYLLLTRQLRLFREVLWCRIFVSHFSGISLNPTSVAKHSNGQK